MIKELQKRVCKMKGINCKRQLQLLSCCPANDQINRIGIAQTTGIQIISFPERAIQQFSNSFYPQARMRCIFLSMGFGNVSD
jgi:hypothetical protein